MVDLNEVPSLLELGAIEQIRLSMGRSPHQAVQLGFLKHH
jgi:hypothetical protein